MLDEVRTKLLELRTQKREESQKYKELLERRQRATAPGREMIEERERLSAEMSKHFANRREIQAELTREMQKHQAYMQQVKRERGLKMREERERRNLENERFQLQRDLERVESELPYEAECLLLNQTIQYLQKIIEEPASNGVEKEQTEPAVDESLAGALLPKSQRKEVFFYAPKQKGKHGKDHEKKKEKPKTLKYDVGTLAYFEQCGLTAPVLIEDVPVCLEKLRAKLQNYKELQQESAQKVDERKAEIMTKIQAVDEKIANLVKKEKLQDDRDGETAEDGSPTAEEADDE
ncbi:Brf1p like coiled coil protein, related [Eimeria mitis]|uniref:Brf1p like coiled coil protein, related n=1 Tax=Eimeria mitis TaxID=44415 RepID=U6JQU7_9EIME|nr:Brf1p like coiled coil protein, related [Eimeria mitis]CDJ27830.1 Brf1p like coiled coil protein, related [Eimeria mitis]